MHRLGWWEGNFHTVSGKPETLFHESGKSKRRLGELRITEKTKRRLASIPSTELSPKPRSQVGLSRVSTVSDRVGGELEANWMAENAKGDFFSSRG